MIAVVSSTADHHTNGHIILVLLFLSRDKGVPIPQQMFSGTTFVGT